jgi:SAM-dependent methyltransferase
MYKTIKKMLIKTREELLEEIARSRKMEADDLKFDDDSFDVVLLRHLHVYIDEIVRVLRPGGYFVTQAVSMNTSIDMLDAFGWTNSGEVLVFRFRTDFGQGYYSNKSPGIYFFKQAA